MKKTLIWIWLAITFALLFHNNSMASSWWPALAYDSQNNKYLCVYEKTTSQYPYYGGPSSDIFGFFINPYGIASNEFAISNSNGYQGRPSVTYDNINKKFLVVWEAYGPYSYNIWGQLINFDGSLTGTNFSISNNWSIDPKVTFDSIDQKFLVVWQTSDDYHADIYGSLINADGTLFPNNNPNTDNFVISNNGNARWPQLAFDSVNQRFLVVWSDYRTGMKKEIYGQFVNNDGSLFNTASDVNFAISDVSNNIDQLSPSVAYADINQKFLVSWLVPISQDNRNVYGQLVNADGTLYPNNNANTDNFVISNKYIYGNSNVRSAYDSINQRFLVVFGFQSLEGQFVNSDGTLYRTTSDVNFSVGGGESPVVAYNSNNANFLVAFCVGNNPDYVTLGFTITPRIYSISGKITNKFNWPLKEVEINLKEIGNENIRATVITDSKGDYTFQSLAPQHYSIVPPCFYKKNIFIPQSRELLLLDDDVSSQNFTATPAPYTLSGKVTKTDGKPFKGVTVTLTAGGCTFTVITNLYGKYSFKVPNGNYVLTASMNGFTFTPANINVNVNGANMTGQNFQQQ